MVAFYLEPREVLGQSRVETGRLYRKQLHLLLRRMGKGIAMAEYNKANELLRALRLYVYRYKDTKVDREDHQQFVEDFHALDIHLCDPYSLRPDDWELPISEQK